MSAVCETRQIPIPAIAISTRLRRSPEQIEALAEDIVDHGLINPVTVMDTGNGTFTLIAGLRRLEAMKFLGVDDIRATVLSPMDADALLAMEFAENAQRQDFTVSERLEYAEKVKAVEKAKARERMAAFAREAKHAAEGVDARPHPEMGKSRDHIAAKVGFGSGRQLDRALVIAEKCPELLEKIDSGETTIYGAYQEIKRQEPVPPADEQLSGDASAPSTQSTAFDAPVDKNTRAKHERLMKNPLYAELYAKHTEAIKAANTARGEMRFEVANRDKVIRGHEENIHALHRELLQLRAENAALRRRLGMAQDEPVFTNTNITNV